MREDGCVMPRHPTHGTEASSSRAALPTPDGTAARLEQERGVTVAAEWEAEVATTRAQLQQDRATLEGARAWQSQAEEGAKEAEQLRTSLADKAASLALAEEQLQREWDARQ
jgi:hypothetical protein